jgi:hypothetical protein
VTSVQSGTYTVAGSVTAVPSGTQTVDGTISVANFPATQAVSGTLGATQSGSWTISVDNLPATQTVAGTISVANLPATQTVDGTISVGNFPATQAVSGTVTNVPSGTQSIAGTVTSVQSGTYTVAGSVTAVPSGTQTVDGTISVANFPATQAVSGTVTAAPSGTYTMTGAGTAGTAAAGVVSIQGINNAFPLNVSVLTQTGIVVRHNSASNVANASTGTISYTVTAGKTFYLKGIIASSSGAPCKVIVDSNAGVLGVGFYASSSPYLAMDFAQAPALSAGDVVNVKIMNNAGSAQDVYATIMGEER